MESIGFRTLLRFISRFLFKLCLILRGIFHRSTKSKAESLNNIAYPFACKNMEKSELSECIAILFLLKF